ncbi:OmpA family protein [Nocardiopsis sp. MG754419]|uniref:OmpA family protein n=1 Tax=Nocardiopsis sp. MG754419 TaxID=2259865 RepID=UPI001BA50E83|nr:OmpA family protein [Nocardiopsis sp. MG754419]MBR8745106.1 OmpA family protein [Nocardiopsis sp. MG754419]
MSPRALGALGAALALSLTLSSCGLVRDLTAGDEPEAPTEAGSEEQAEEVAAEELPFTRQGRMFVEDGNDVAFEVVINALESNGEYLMIDVTHNILEPLPGAVTSAVAPIRMVDPLSGEVLRVLSNDDHGENYGTYFVEGDPFLPTHEGLPLPMRRYFPAPSEEVETLTFTGAGLGYVPGVPISYVDEFTESPEPNVYDHIDPETWEQGELPDEIFYPDDVPESGLDVSEDRQSVESFVDSDIASTTRAGDQETIALHADDMFEVDEAEPTDEAAETIRQTAASLRENLAEGTEITVIGHTDGTGSDDHNQTLSENRAESARELVEEELGDGFTLTTEGRGADELLAEEGGDDDEEARARNRRVEFFYEVPLDASDSEDTDGLDAAQRHVAEPAAYFEDMEAHTTVSHNDLDLNVYPLVRDGAYLFQVVGFQNSTLGDLEADLEGDEARLPGSPAQYTEGTMGGFRLEEPETGLIRYVVRIRTGEEEYEDFADEIHTLSPGEEYLALAVFPAPATDVSEMTLYAGAFGEIAGVPIR